MCVCCKQRKGKKISSWIESVKHFGNEFSTSFCRSPLHLAFPIYSLTFNSTNQDWNGLKSVPHVVPHSIAWFWAWNLQHTHTFWCALWWNRLIQAKNILWNELLIKKSLWFRLKLQANKLFVQCWPSASFSLVLRHANLSNTTTTTIPSFLLNYNEIN